MTQPHTPRHAVLLLFLLLPALLTAARQTRLTEIDTDNRLQQNQGWGTSLCWWANMCGRWQDEQQFDSLLTLLCSPGHLNFNIFRYNIGGGDDPQWCHCEPHHFGGRNGKGLRAEMPGFKDSADDEYHWERDEAQRRVMLRIRQLRPDALFEAFSNSAPYYLTESGCVGGAVRATDDNVAPRHYEAFARYLVDVCQMYHDRYQLDFYTLDPFNEPVTDYWYANGSQEGCHFSTKSQIRLLRVLAPMLHASGLPTQISASDETDIGQSVRDFKAYAQDGDALAQVAQWNTHSYHGSHADRVQLRQLARQAGKRLWMSESGDGGRGIHGNLMMAQRLIDDIRLLQPDTWIDWQYMEEHGDQWSLVSGDWNRGEFHLHKNYYVRYQFSHFIRQGYTYLDTDNPHLLAAISPDGSELVTVVINTDRQQSASHELHFSHFRPATAEAYRTSHSENAQPCSDFTLHNDRLSFTLPPLSAVTFVLHPVP